MLEIYLYGVIAFGMLYAAWALVILAIRAYRGIQKFVERGHVDFYDDSWYIFESSDRNHPVGFAVNTAIYTVCVALAAAVWVLTCIPAILSMVAVIKRASHLKAEEAEKVMIRLEGNR